MPYTSWLLGSTYLNTLTSYATINASPKTVNAGSYYLTDLLDEVVADIEAEEPGAGWYLTRNRRVRIYTGATFSVTWTSTAFMTLLGFTGNLSGAATYTAPNISPLFWSPGRTESPLLSPLGTLGHRVENTIFGVADDGTTVATTTGYRTYQQWRWSYIDTDRIQTTSEAGGEYVRFFREVLSKGYNFKLYRNIPEDGTTADVTLPTALGPYAMTPRGRTPDWDFSRSRGFEQADGRNDLDLSAHVAPEYA